MYKVIILQKAQIDTRRASEWYNQQQKGLGKKLIKQFRKRVKQIKKDPLSCEVRYLNIRTASTEVFPYMIHYTIEEEQKTIIISAFFHTSLSPDNWTERHQEKQS
ncbi:MAG: type II toxin-antitoxin system RelE/ParE family toxin [Flavobacteriales bacterium]